MHGQLVVQLGVDQVTEIVRVPVHSISATVTITWLLSSASLIDRSTTWNGWDDL